METASDVIEKTPLLGRSSSTSNVSRNYSLATEDRTTTTSSSHDDAITAYSNHDKFPDGTSSDERNGLAPENMETSAHCHSQVREEDLSARSARRKLIGVSLLCVVFMVGEIVGGVIANSLAIATDAAHLLSDLAGFLISLFAIFIASRPATKRMSFGWHRAEVMGAMLSVLVIWVVTIVLVYLAVLRVIHQDYEINSKIMLIMSLLSIAFNVIMMIVLGFGPNTHGHSHGFGLSHGHSHKGKHSHGNSGNHSHAGTETQPHSSTVTLAPPDVAIVEKGKGRTQEENINVRAAYIHALGDLIQSIGVFIAAMVIYFKPEAKIADPICTFVFSVLVMATTFTILRDALSVLMEAAPKDLSFNEIRTALCAIEGVTELHDLRLWQLTTNKPALSVHLAIDSTVDTQQVLATARTVVRENFRIYECTFQVERYVTQMGDCEKCQDPRE